jgi:hypothetical protein
MNHQSVLFSMNLIVVLTAFVSAAGACFTTVCKEHPASFLYDAGTFGGDNAALLRSTPLDANRRFRAAQGACAASDLCLNGAYACAAHGDTACFHVLRIVTVFDLPPGCPLECTMVPGNMVMASGAWNSALGGLALTNSAAALSEKAEVMGARIVNSSLGFVSTCCGLAVSPGPVTGPTTYDHLCDTAGCNCDALGCGCDCDFEITPDTFGFLYAFIHSNYAIMSVILFVVVALFFYLCVRLRRLEKRGFGPSGDVLLPEPPNEVNTFKPIEPAPRS